MGQEQDERMRRADVSYKLVMVVHVCACNGYAGFVMRVCRITSRISAGELHGAGLDSVGVSGDRSGGRWAWLPDSSEDGSSCVEVCGSRTRRGRVARSSCVRARESRGVVA